MGPFIDMACHYTKSCHVLPGLFKSTSEYVVIISSIANNKEHVQNIFNRAVCTMNCKHPTLGKLLS